MKQKILKKNYDALFSHKLGKPMRTPYHIVFYAPFVRYKTAREISVQQKQRQNMRENPKNTDKMAKNLVKVAAKKKIGHAARRNFVKRRLRNMLNELGALPQYLLLAVALKPCLLSYADEKKMLERCLRQTKAKLKHFASKAEKIQRIAPTDTAS